MLGNWIIFNFMYKVPARLARLERSSQSILYTWWFMTCGHYCRIWFPRSLWSKKLISIWVLLAMVMKLWWIFNCCKWPPVTAHHKSHYELQPAGTGTVSGSCNLQLTLFTTERQLELRPVLVFSKTCLKRRSCKLEAI